MMTEKAAETQTDKYWGQWMEVDADSVLITQGGRITEELLEGKDFIMTPNDSLMNGGPIGEVDEGYPIQYIHQAERPKSDPFPEHFWYDVGYFKDGPRWYPMLRGYDEVWFYQVGIGDVIITADGKAFTVLFTGDK